jgi:hypothetical protein
MKYIRKWASSCPWSWVCYLGKPTRVRWPAHPKSWPVAITLTCLVNNYVAPWSGYGNDTRISWKYCRPSTTTKLTTLTSFFHIRVVTTSKLTIFFHPRVVTTSKLTIFFHPRIVTTSKLTIFFHPRVVTTSKLTIVFHPLVVTNLV